MPEQSVRFGASVTGPAHREAGLANQDAWTSGQFRTADSTVVQFLAVCDGLGSRPQARAKVRAPARAPPVSPSATGGPAAQASPGQLIRLVRVAVAPGGLGT